MICPTCGHDGFAFADYGLTPGEKRVARCIREGYEDAEIAVSLGIKLRTVKARLGRVYDKLGVTDRLQLAIVLVAPLDSPLRAAVENKNRN